MRPPAARAARARGARAVDLDALVAGVRERRSRALGRAVSVIEDGGAARAELVRRIYGDTGRARVVGITGPPGAGKSTLVDRLTQALRARGETVGILCVDPTSPFSGGALLGDRIRMQERATDPGVFIRSMATRGALGGLARATRDAVDLLDAAGFDWVLVETVGVGQDEVDVVASVDTVVVVTVPGLGDDIQAIKAGILEIADVFVINKADREGADRAHRDLATMLSLADALDWTPPIVRTVAAKSEGVAELLAEVERHRAWMAGDGRLAVRRRAQLKLRVEGILQERVLAAARDEAGLEAELERAFAARVDPYRVADALFRGVVRAESERGETAALRSEE
ncbi:MAG: methylmalonyl Co-A mutase-associated GTPase MeaB [Thermoanaerobaculia bacterium]|nr:methylmalonyl Co-A mutase-associated GTPase MeaB [Thermoanaerobaculia bacterium]